MEATRRHTPSIFRKISRMRLQNKTMPTITVILLEELANDSVLHAKLMGQLGANSDDFDYDETVPITEIHDETVPR